MSDIKYVKIGKVEDRVIEECAELTKAICKAKRFGLDDFYPNTKKSNRADILNEIRYVLKVIVEYVDVLKAGKSKCEICCCDEVDCKDCEEGAHHERMRTKDVMDP